MELRIASWAALLSIAVYLFSVWLGFSNPHWEPWFLRQASMLIAFISLAAIAWVPFLRRAQRMMTASGTPGGMMAAVAWGFDNGDVPIRLAYASSALAVMMACIQLLVLDRPPLEYIAFFFFPMFVGLICGHVGNARCLPSRAVATITVARVLILPGLFFICIMAVPLLSPRGIRSDVLLDFCTLVFPFFFSVVSSNWMSVWVRNYNQRLNERRQSQQQDVTWRKARLAVARQAAR
jgi:hypothetical protein